MKKRALSAVFLILGVFVLIIDSKTALYGASEGLTQCIRSVIPSMLPFFFLSILLTDVLFGMPLPFLSPLGKFCSIPRGAEALLIIGILGGYPTGAQCINHAYVRKQISKPTAMRMLGFCNNAGPAFLFGIVAGQFSRARYAWGLWFIQILSACIVGALLPYNAENRVTPTLKPSLSPSLVVKKAMIAMGQVCAWIILCRVLVEFSTRWFLWMLPNWAQIAFVGSLELANGCFLLHTIDSQCIRFFLATFLLSLGGICVLLQTKSVTADVGMGKFVVGKLIQTILALLLAAPTWYILSIL